VGTVSIAGPVYRLSREKLVGFLPRLRPTAIEFAALELLLARWRRGVAAGPGGEREVS
jgi:hypothetical protein